MGLCMSLITSNPEIIGGLVVAIAAVIVIWGNALAFIVDTKVTDQGLVFSFLTVFPIASVPFEHIRYIDRAGFGFPNLFAYNLKTRPLEKKYYVELKSGWFASKFLISPAAVDDLEGKLQKNGIQIGIRR